MFLLGVIGGRQRSLCVNTTEWVREWCALRCNVDIQQGNIHRVDSICGRCSCFLDIHDHLIVYPP